MLRNRRRLSRKRLRRTTRKDMPHMATALAISTDQKLVTGKPYSYSGACGVALLCQLLPEMCWEVPENPLSYWRL